MGKNDFTELEELTLLENETLGENSKLNLKDFRTILKPYFEQLYMDTSLSNNPFVILDTRLNIRWQNKQFLKIFGHGKSLKNQYITNIFSSIQIDDQDLDISDLFKKIRDAKSGYSLKVRVSLYNKMHATIFADLIIIPTLDPNTKKPLAYLGIFSDITRENKKILRQTFLSLLEASKLKDNDTGQHIERVNKYSRLLAKALFDHHNYPEVDVEFIENISFLASMHDVGKIGTPDDILNKKDSLDDREWTIMKEHTINGGYILSTYPNPMARQIALFHHEKWNGTGYPYALSEEMIPLAARIVAIADVYDALRMERSYKKAFSHEKACDIIFSGSGEHFDPHLIEYFSRLHTEFDEVFSILKD